MTTLHTCKPVPHLDARLAAAAAYVRPGHIAADIGCDHGKLSAWLAGSGCCPLVFACDLREGPLQKARMTCAPWADKIQFRLGSGLSVLQPGEATEIIIAGMGAETVLEILDAAPWVRINTSSNTSGYRLRSIGRNGNNQKNNYLCLTT